LQDGYIFAARGPQSFDIAAFAGRGRFVGGKIIAADYVLINKDPCHA